MSGCDENTSDSTSIHRPIPRHESVSDSEMVMIGSSQRFLDFQKELRAGAVWNRKPILLVGERGSGKELAARAVHLWSPRCHRTFLAVSMPAMYDDLVADELFGHVRNAFTGATEARAGAFATADNGTLFLDEIADMRFSTQAALLRVIDTGEAKAIGDDLPRHVDVRIVAATNQSLSLLVKEGRFRADLYDRLRCFEIHVPPLRERLADLPALCAYFLRECCKFAGCALKKPQHCAANAGMVDCATHGFYLKLMNYDWPGNIRELQFLVEGMRSMHLNEVLDDTHLPEIFRNEKAPASTADLSLETVIRKHLALVLQLNKGNISRTASALKIPRSSLKEKMRKLGIRI